MEDEDLQNKNLIELIDWCRKRCTILQTEEMAEMTRKQLTSQFGKRTMHSVQDRRVEQPEEPADKPVPDNDDDLQEALRVAPAWAQKLFAVRQAPPPPRAHSAERPPRDRNGQQQRGRSPQRGGSRDRNGRSPGTGSRNRLVGWDNKCFHCGSIQHTRNNCDSFKKMMKDHNGSKAVKDWRPPPGYESALAKAQKARKAKEDVELYYANVTAWSVKAK